MAEKGMFVIDVRPDDGDEFRLTATSRDVSLWERTHKGRSLKQIEQNYSMSLMEELTVVACRRQRRWTGSLDEFREGCDIEVIDTSKDALRELLDRAVADEVITEEQAEAIAALDAEPGEIETLDPTRPDR